MSYDKIYDEKLPLMKIRKKSQNIKTSISQLLIIRVIRNLPLDIFFEEKNMMKLLKIYQCIAKDVKMQGDCQ